MIILTGRTSISNRAFRVHVRNRESEQRSFLSGIPRHASLTDVGSIVGMSGMRYRLGLWSSLVLGLLILAAGIGWHQARAKSWRTELSLAVDAMRAGRFGRAGERLARLAEHWTDGGEVLLLLGECEFLRGRREEALAAWARVSSTDRSFPAPSSSGRPI